MKLIRKLVSLKGGARDIVVMTTVAALLLLSQLTASSSASAQIIESATSPVGPPPGSQAQGSADPPRSLTRKAPPGSEPPASDPHSFAGVWTVESTRNQVLYELKPEFVGKLPAPALSSFATPNIGSRQCHPTAYFGQIVSAYPMEIVQTDKQLNFIFEENRRVRRIYLNEKLPNHPKPAYFGHSAAHWEGDTLVVETNGLKGMLDFQQTGNPDLHIIERIKKVEGGSVLQYDVTYYNDKQWAKPGSFTVRYNWRPDLSLMEVICEEFSDHYGRGYDSLR